MRLILDALLYIQVLCFTQGLFGSERNIALNRATWSNGSAVVEAGRVVDGDINTYVMVTAISDPFLGVDLEERFAFREINLRKLHGKCV